MLFQITSYIQFLFKSTNKHGVHSPFVFNLVTKCFNKKVSSKKVSTHKGYKESLFSNKNNITVTDFGKGSKVFKSNTRQISKIAKVAGISKQKSNLLIKLVEYFQPNEILEIGTSLGVGTACLAIGNPESTITTLEGCPETIAIAKEQFEKHQLKTPNFITGNFTKTLSNALKDKTYDLIYFDGNHQNKPTLEYFHKSLDSIHNNSIMIFDDIHWSKEMLEAWEEIKQHPKVTVTIDVFFWGIVFFRKEQLKEHFTIRT